MANIDVQDLRKFFMLPQGYEGGGYYTYGRPGNGSSQYVHPQLLTLILRVANIWAQSEERKFGVGDISLANGPRHPDHNTHRSGLEVDIRPVRKDGRRMPCSIYSSDYDRAATAKLIGLFNDAANVRHVLFNDAKIANVRHAGGHNDHFHVALIGG